jgi:carbon monoxide dehydrogenase subunit G
VAAIDLKAERTISAPLAKTLTAVRTPSTYSSWVPGIVAIQDETSTGDFTCVFQFSVFNLKFKVTKLEADGNVTRFRTSAVIVGKIDASVTVTAVSADTSQVKVQLGGLLRSSVMHRMAVSLFEKGADVVSQRLSAYLAAQRSR